MAIQETSELQVGSAENPLLDGPLEEGLLSRRDFLKFASVLPTAIGLSELPTYNTSEGVAFWDAVYSVYKLKIDPNSVKLDKAINEKWQKQTVLSFISNIPIEATDPLQQNPQATVSKITINFSAFDKSHNSKNIHTASNLGAFLRTSAIIGKAIDAFKVGGSAAASSILSANTSGDVKKWLTSKKGILAGISVLGLASLACKIAWEQLEQTQTSPEGKEATKQITALPFDGSVTPSATSENGNVEVKVTPIPEIPPDFAGISLTGQYFRDNGQILQYSRNNQEIQPNPTSVPYQDTGEFSLEDSFEFTKKAFGGKELDLGNPADLIKYLAAQGAIRGTNVGVTFFQGGINGEDPAFANLSIYREQTSIDQQEYTISEGYPNGLVLRDGSGISIIGKDKDGNIFISFEEYQKRNENEFYPRIRFALLTPNEFGRISSGFLKLKYYIDKDFMTFADNGVDRKVGLNHIDDEVFGLLLSEFDKVWIDKTIAEGKLMPEPLVAYPDEQLLQGISKNDYSYKGYLNEAKPGIAGQVVEAVSPDGQRKLYSSKNQETDSWIWSEGFKTDSWATDANGLINKDVMAGVVNKALIEDKYAFDMYFGEMKVAVVDDEDLSQTTPEHLAELRNNIKTEIENEEGRKCINQILRAIPFFRKSLNNDNLQLKDCQAIIERNFDGILQVTSIIVVENNNTHLYRFQLNGEIAEAEIFPMFPNLEINQTSFEFTYPVQENWLPPAKIYKGVASVTIVDDPTSQVSQKVFRNEIFGPRTDDKNHPPFYPSPDNNLGDPFSPPPPYNNTGRFTHWGMPVEMLSTIYLDRIENGIGVNPQDYGNGKHIWSLAGDMHISNPSTSDTGDIQLSFNSILVSQDNSWYILPATHNSRTQIYEIGSIVDYRNPILEKQWIELKSIITNEGNWILMRLRGQNRFKAMGYVKQLNPNAFAANGNFGPYASPNVGDILMYQFELTVKAWGPVEYE